MRTGKESTERFEVSTVVSWMPAQGGTLFASHGLSVDLDIRCFELSSGFWLPSRHSSSLLPTQAEDPCARQRKTLLQT